MKNRFLGTAACVLFLLVLLPGGFGGGGALFAQDSPSGDLFSDVRYRGNMERFLDATIVRTRFVKINFERLPGASASTSRPSGVHGLELNLFGGVFYRAVPERVDTGKQGRTSWTGVLEGVKGSRVILVYKDGIMAGNIILPGAFYQVRFASGGVHAINELDHTKFAPCGVDEDAGASQQSQAHGHLSSGQNLSQPSDNGSSIDVMVVYNQDARSGAGGATAMENEIALAVSETNTGYSSSGVSPRINLVYTAEVNYAPSGSIFTDRSRLQGSSDGYMDDVHGWRDTYGADIVALITEDGGGYCGVASMMSTVSSSMKNYAFCVVKRSCATGYYSFGHELGHIMGARHDRYVDNTDNRPYQYNHGFVNVAGQWRTIMAYNTECDDASSYCWRINYWSNPSKTYGGDAMGVAEGDPAAADNRKTLNNTAYTVANFRQHVSSPAPTPASITVTSPDGGETWTAGASKTIQWSTSGSVGNVKIRYSVNNGSSWSTVTSSTSNDGSYTWTVANNVSTQCRVKISEASDGDPTDASNAVFTIQAASPATPTITVTSPDGGESPTGGSAFAINWSSTGSVGNVKIHYSVNNGGSWSTVSSSTANDGVFNWSVPNIDAGQCLIKISEASDGDPSDTSNGSFSISAAAAAASVTVTSPNGGESIEGGASYNIQWSSTGTVGNVKIQYSTDSGANWTNIASSTSNDGSHSWTAPEIESSKCYVKVSEASDGNPYDASNQKFTIYLPEPAEIELSRNSLDFGADTAGTVTGGQTVLIDNSGEQTLNWSASTGTGSSWLSAGPTSGSGAGAITVSVNASGLAAGSYSGTVTVSDPDASNSPQAVTVSLKVYGSSTTAIPFGDFSSPINGSTLSSSVPVTGWVVDDIEAVSVKLYNGSDYIGDAVFVEGSRPDIEQGYPGYPKNYQAGWGYMLLTHFLPGGGNGAYTLTARATDAEGNVVTLGSRTITIDNDNAIKPFGAIDTPNQGGVASGGKYVNWAWVLTPRPNSIPTDGSTISVWVDGVKLGNPTYNIYRADIANLFPGYANTDGAIGYYYLDTSGYKNGIHIIQWTAKDTAGNSDGIGSRYFRIQNTGAGSSASGTSDMPQADSRRFNSKKPRVQIDVEQLQQLPFDPTGSVFVRRGYRSDAPLQAEYAGDNGEISIEISELERIEVRFFNPFNREPSSTYSLAQGTSLPIGATLDSRNGVFYWQPGAGYIGRYSFDFIKTGAGADGTASPMRVKLNVFITPNITPEQD
jgi:hypothetical protein